MAESFILALDQGTTSSRALIFDRAGRVRGMAQQEFPQLLPQPGHVEHDPEAIWSSQLATAQQALAAAGMDAAQIAAVGITNQRETTVIWDRVTGRAVSNAIVWQSRITAPICEALKAAGHEPLFRERTGLLLDPYFSGTKVKYLLDQNPAWRERAARGELLFGTIDSWLIYRLSGGRTHVTDPSNASRTLMFDIHRLTWDDELLRVLDVPRAMLPTVVESSGVCGATDPCWFGRSLPIAGLAGDQQAATFGQCCFEPGDAKNTYGTGCFMLLNTGPHPVASQNRLLTTVGWTVGGRTTYCLEGAVFVGGAVIQWLRDELHLAETSTGVGQLAAAVDDAGGVYFVPAFVGLGAPYWDPYARGMLIGLTRGTSAGQIARAAVESMAYQSADLLDAMQRDTGEQLKRLKVDGGAAVNDQLLQFQADVLGVTVQRPEVAETTALGAAYLAGLGVGYWSDLDDIRGNWRLEREFVAALPSAVRTAKLSRWRAAVERCRNWEEA